MKLFRFIFGLYYLPQRSHSLLVSLLLLVIRYLLALVLIALLLFVAASMIATFNNQVFENGRFNEMLGFFEYIVAAMIYGYGVLPISAVAFITQIIRLLRRGPPGLANGKQSSIT